MRRPAGHARPTGMAGSLHAARQARCDQGSPVGDVRPPPWAPRASSRSGGPMSLSQERRGDGARYAVFPTTIGPCGIVWDGRGIIGTQLPEATAQQTSRRLEEQYPGSVEAAPPPAVKTAIKAITAHLARGDLDLAAVSLVMDDIPPFRRRAYEEARRLAPGTTASYGQIAARIGSPGAARAVGQAMGHNPFPIVVPCHRVLAAGGRLGGFSATGGATTKRRMLAIEGVAMTGGDGAPKMLRLPFDARRALAHIRGNDPTLAGAMRALGPFSMALEASGSTFSALAEAIVYQQLSPKAASVIHMRFCQLFGRADAPLPEQVLAASEDLLRSAGISRAKVAAVRDLAARYLDGTLPTLEQARRMADEDLIRELSRVKGVGRWTAEMFLMFRLGRPDVLPLGDYGLQRGFAAVFTDGHMPTPQEMEAQAERWRPYRTVACWYLWRAAEAASHPAPAGTGGVRRP